jgi:hypothetical protein
MELDLEPPFITMHSPPSSACLAMARRRPTACDVLCWCVVWVVGVQAKNHKIELAGLTERREAAKGIMRVPPHNHTPTHMTMAFWGRTRERRKGGRWTPGGDFG